MRSLDYYSCVFGIGAAVVMWTILRIASKKNKPVEDDAVPFPAFDDPRWTYAYDSLTKIAYQGKSEFISHRYVLGNFIVSMHDRCWIKEHYLGFKTDLYDYIWEHKQLEKLEDIKSLATRELIDAE